MGRLFYSIIFLFAFLSFQTTSFSQPITLLRDINSELYTGPTYYPREPLNLTQANGMLFFNIYGGYGSYGGLWRTDGTDAGTVRVKDVYSIEKMLNVNGTLFFTTAGELWKSDGSEAGTVLVKNVSATDLININGTLFFTNDAGLWKSDGTENGTVLVKAVAGVKNMTNVNGILFFNSLRALWKSDGTDAGTVIVSDSFSEFGDIKEIVNVDGIVFLFFTYYNGWLELWRSDGTENGTSIIMTNELGGSIYDYETRNFTSLNGKLYFFAGTTSGTALWQSDGTEAGTFEVKVLNESSYLQELFVFNGNLFFSAFDQDHGMELWKSDGTSVGTQMLKDIFPGYYNATYPNGSVPGSFFNLNGTLYFTAYDDYGRQLWKSDGTAAGTITVGGLCTGPSSLTNVNGVLFFVAAGLYGREIWKSNGIAAGTIMVKDIFPTRGSNPREFVLLNGVGYFAADPNIRGSTFSIREQLFRTDGTVANTFAFSGLSPMSQANPQNLTVFKGQVFFSANDNYGRYLWKSDGTSAGTVKVKPINVITPNINEPGNHSKFCVVNQTMFFSATEGSSGVELWKTDGTEAGTILVKDINVTGDSHPRNLTNVNGTLFFVADNGISGQELWKSDGTELGTVLVKNINSGSNNSNPAYLTAINGVLYFTADDGVHGIELWKSDGTEAGTVLVKNINAIANSNPASLTNINAVLYFSADDGIHGVEAWKSDGTDAGTVLLKDIYSGPDGSNPTLFTNLNGIVLFAANNGIAGRELWGSNGTDAGTILIKDIQPGSAGSNPSALKKIGNNVLFAANDGLRGNEVWLSNGAEAGTRLMSEIEPGAAGSDPTEFFEYGSKVLVAATNGMVGNEVWIADVPAGSPLPLDLLEFKGVVVNDDGVLKWKTDNESNTSSFIVERSLDGRNYSSVGSVSSANSPGVHYYDFTDINIVSLGANNIYYRLKQTDIDGRYTYSNIVVLSIDNKKSIVMLYPNPTKDKINMTITISQHEKLQWQLTDNTGRTIKQGFYNLSAGSTAVSIDIASLASGTYLVQLNGTTLQKILKVVKQ